MPISDNTTIGHKVTIHHKELVNLYGCKIGDYTKIGTFVEIQQNATVGKYCKIQSHSFICEGVTIEDEVFIGHGVLFINDKFPKSTTKDGILKTKEDWNLSTSLIKKGASIGSGATIMCGVTIGENAIIGAGSVVTRNIPPKVVVAGVPAVVIRDLEKGEDS